ncbi:hypothetical protein AHAS_Ahas10G0080800 [Arachis hypogaea]
MMMRIPTVHVHMVVLIIWTAVVVKAMSMVVPIIAMLIHLMHLHAASTAVMLLAIGGFFVLCLFRVVAAVMATMGIELVATTAVRKHVMMMSVSKAMLLGAAEEAGPACSTTMVIHGGKSAMWLHGHT